MNHRHWLIGTAILLGLLLLMAVTVVASEGTSPASSTAVAVWWVDDDACPGPGAGTPGDPFCRIQQAIDAASPDDEVRVAGGTYRGTQSVIATNGYTYTQVVFITQSVALLGGFDAAWTTRDPAANPTTIDAERSGRGITVLGTRSEIATIDGFTITGGDYTGLGNPDGVGVAMCRHTGVDCGGGLFVYRAALILHDCVVHDNIASRDNGHGGGIYLWETSYNPPVEIQNVQVISNAAGGPQGSGGGIYSYRIDGGMQVVESLFQDNFADTDGGGLYLYDTRSPVEIVNTSILSNVADAQAGGAAIRLATNGEVLHIDRTIIQGNEADTLVGLYIFAGGNASPRAHVTNLLLAGNRAREADAEAGVVGIDAGATPLSVTFAHVTAADNVAPTFLSVRPTTGRDPVSVTVAVANTLVVSFTNAFVVEEKDPGAMTLRHSHTLSREVDNLHVVLGGLVNIVATDQQTGDPMLDSTYHLQEGSAAIGEGKGVGVDHDIDGEPRPLTNPDIGADEWWFAKAFLPLVTRG